MFELLATNTNLYTEGKRKGKTSQSQESQPTRAERWWTETTAAELKIFVGLTIKMGLHKEARVPLYWSKRGQNGWRKISKRPLQRYRSLSAKKPYRVPRNCMSLNRFQQLKRYLHILDPRVELDLKHWYAKIEPLGSMLRERFQKYYLPGTKVAIDEMVIRFSGRSRHTLKIRNKPIKKGYKIFALCDHGYTYEFLWYSSTQGIAELTVSAASSSTSLPIASSSTPTSKGVLHLARSLPSGFR